MNKETMKEILKEAHTLATADDLKRLVVELEDLLRLQEAIANEPKNETLKTELMAVRERLWTQFDAVLQTRGITSEFLKEQIKDPSLFTAKNKEIYEKLQKIHKGM